MKWLIPLLMLSACATHQADPSDAKPVPREHIYNAKYLSVQADNEGVTFTRDIGVQGRFCADSIFVDNDKAFDIWPGEYVTIRLEPGDHYFRLETGEGICLDQVLSQPTNIKLGEPQTFRISILPDYKLQLIRTQ